MPIEVIERLANGGRVRRSPVGVDELSLPALPARKYGLAQLDDYMHLPRKSFLHQPPLKLTLEARVSAAVLPGTWGFGLWNDPFSFGFGAGGMARALPVLPNVAWFFYGSAENHLTLDDAGPGAGFHVKVYQSPRLPAVMSLLAAPALPFLIWPAFVRLMRRLARLLVAEDARSLNIDTTEWHTYLLSWTVNGVVFSVDNDIVMRTTIVPQGPLGLVIWIDNQYFKFSPEGKLGFGFLEYPAAGWLQVRHLDLSSDP